MSLLKILNDPRIHYVNMAFWEWEESSAKGGKRNQEGTKAGHSFECFRGEIVIWIEPLHNEMKCVATFISLSKCIPNASLDKKKLFQVTF
jgi:hypothetical protein